MTAHPYVLATLAADRQAALLAEAQTASLARQARRESRKPFTRSRLLARGRRPLLASGVRRFVAEIDYAGDVFVDPAQPMDATIASDIGQAMATQATP